MSKLFLHITLSFSIFFSSAGFWISDHYCQGKFIKTNYIFSFGCCESANEAHSCTIEKRGCDNHSEDKEKKCCDEDSEYFKLEQDQEIPLAEIKPIKNLTSNVNPVSKLDDKLFVSQLFKSHNYFPPNIVYDRQVRFESFLC